MSGEQLLEFRVNKVEEAIESMAENLRAIVRLEEHHKESREAIGRAFAEINANRISFEKSCEKVDARLRNVELSMPILKMTSRWIIGGTISIVTGVFGTLGVILWALLPYIMNGSGG